MRERDYSIDIAKGLLILSVIFLHIGWFLWAKCGGNNEVFIFGMKISEYSFMSFFMPAFFFIHGYCSSHSKTLIDECKTGIKTLLVPMLLLNVWHTHWFCWAMFFGCICYNAIRHIRSECLKVIILVSMVYVGTFLSNRGLDWTDLDYALFFTPFIYIGEKCKKLRLNPTIGMISGGGNFDYFNFLRLSTDSYPKSFWRKL